MRSCRSQVLSTLAVLVLGLLIHSSASAHASLAPDKLPTAYPSRRVWLNLTVRDRDGRTVFASGSLNPDGSIEGNDNDVDAQRYEPHYPRIETAGQVQVTPSCIQWPLMRRADPSTWKLPCATSPLPIAGPRTCRSMRPEKPSVLSNTTVRWLSNPLRSWPEVKRQ